MWLCLFVFALLLFLFAYLYWRLRLKPYIKSPLRCYVVHDVTDNPGFTSASQISSAQLEAFLHEAWNAGVEFVTLKEWLEQATDNAVSSPSKHALLTFDDGLESFYTHVYPILKKRRVPAVVFLVTSFESKAATWDYRSANRLHLSRQHIEEITRDGLVEFGSHSASHADLTRISEESVASEIQPAEFSAFSYPFGRFSECVVETVARSGYRAAFCGTNGDPALWGFPYTIPRIPLNRFDNRFTLRVKLRGSMVYWSEVMKARIIGMFSPLTFDLRSMR
jgi:peptidoglycan/xylan/chitin deacetylase (PgdA/CDA1 family)